MFSFLFSIFSYFGGTIFNEIVNQLPIYEKEILQSVNKNLTTNLFFLEKITSFVRPNYC